MWLFFETVDVSTILEWDIKGENDTKMKKNRLVFWRGQSMIILHLSQFPPGERIYQFFQLLSRYELWTIIKNKRR